MKPSISVILIDCITPVLRLAIATDCGIRRHVYRNRHGTQSGIVAKTIGKPNVSVTYSILEHRRGHSDLRVTRRSYHDNDFRYHDDAWRYHDNANLSYSIGLSYILATCTNERRATEK